MKFFTFILLIIVNCISLLKSEEYEINGFLNIWEKEEKQVLPTPITKNLPIKLNLKTTNEPDTFEVKNFVYKTTETYKLEINISFFSIFSSTDGKYFVSQIKINGDINIFCGAYMNKEDFFPFPVFFCSQKIRENPTKYIGITLSRKPI